MGEVTKYPFDASDFAAFERWFQATYARCCGFRDRQQHEIAARCVTGCRGLFESIREAAKVHGFLAEIIIGDWERKLMEFYR